jgi:hypothetical protein
MKEKMKESIPFFKTIWLALNPWRYDELGEKPTRSVFKYFFSFVFMAFVLAILFMLPAIAGLVTNQMDHFDVLEVKFNTTMNSPVVFPENNPYITLDTRKEEGKLKEGKFLITDDYLYRKKMFTGKVAREPLGPYKNLLANEGMVILLLLLMMPSLLFLFYIGYAIKVLLVVLIAAVLGLVLGRIIKFELQFVDALKAGLLAATPMIIIDLIRLPFALNVYFAQYIAFLIFFIVGIIKVGEFEGASPRRRKGKKGRYVDLTKRV